VSERCPSCGQSLGVQILAVALFDFCGTRIAMAAQLGESSGMFSADEEAKAKAILAWGKP
jgi:hypothetical protein